MILVTGATGFIGKHLIVSLIDKFGKDNVIALTSKSIDHCNYLLHHNYNTDELNKYETLFNKIKTIIHAGAFTPKKSSESNLFIENNKNIINTNNLLNSSFSNLEKIVYISSIDVYEYSVNQIDESNIPNPSTLYGFSKLYSEKMIEAWATNKSIAFQILRVGHVYGPGEEAYSKIIPTIFNALLNKGSIKLFGDGEELRSYIFIEDVIKSIIATLDIKKELGVINIVGGNEVSIKMLIQEIQSITSHSINIERVEITGFSPKNITFNSLKMSTYILKKQTAIKDGLRNEWEYLLKKTRRNLFFDLDGTILDSSDRMYSLFVDLVPECKLTKNEYWDLKRDEIDHRSILNEIFNYSEEKNSKFQENWMILIETEKYLQLDTVYINVHETLELLKRNNNLYIVTARQSKDSLLVQLNRLKLTDFFKEIFITEQRAEKFELINNKLFTTTKDVFIGDTGNDILTGKKLKINTIGITHGFTSYQKLKKYNSDSYANSIEELLNILN